MDNEQHTEVRRRFPELPVGRQSAEVPGHFGDPLTVEHALWSRGEGHANPGKSMFLLLHGWGSNEQDMADLMSYIAPYNDYVALRAPLPLPAQYRNPEDDGVRATWFHDAVPAGEDRDHDAYAAAVAIDDWVAANIPESRDVVPLGFSQGGLLAVHLLRLNPRRYRAVICLSGFLAQGSVAGTTPGDADLDALQVPVFFGFGDKDQVLPRNEHLAMSAWLEEHTYLKYREYPKLDHAVSLSEFDDIRQWLSDNNITSGIM
ncbi:esterase [Bifidobacterium margollesii]|uniref:Esterase n=1 Tax=Bifidobacterium margollesii TaxID=2020964 RepID=A0A2N5JD42_9BIFI|nr:alpha/beta hydrolase-fold protein [Bifidobacterium margollesii]PLS32136.1 esterase [Bifidobacterium margollesii]